MPKKVPNPRLKSLQELWAQTEAIKGYIVPDGKYDLAIEKMEMNDGSAGRLQVIVSYIILGGDQDGKKPKQFFGMETPVGIGFFKGYCEVIGLEIPEDMTELPQAIDAFYPGFKGILHVIMRTKGEYQNIYLTDVSFG